MKRIVPLELHKNLMRIAHVRIATDQNRAIQTGFSSNISYHHNDDLALAEVERRKAEAQAAAFRRPLL